MSAPHRLVAGRQNEKGIIIILVAIFILFVMGAMAALSIDITTFYTARSEAQLAADSAALAAARVLANSGLTSDPSAATLQSAGALAKSVALQVAQQNQIGGGAATTITINDPVNCGLAPTPNDLCVTVSVSRSDLPTFFARIWGTTQITVSASATAEVYNPSGLPGTASSPSVPVAPVCVKPLLLPNQPVSGPTIFTNLATGAANSALLGQTISGLTDGAGAGGPAAWQYLPGDTSSTGTFFPVSSAACNGSAGFTQYQLAIAGCVQTPIACNATASFVSDGTLDPDTTAAVNCLTHSNANGGDKIDPSTFPAGPFEFLAGSDDPAVQAGLRPGTDVLLSDSLATVPVYGTLVSSSSVNIVGFVQLFLNSNGQAAPSTGPIQATIVNMVGCGTSATGNPIIGNGPSAVAVRLVTPPQ